MADYLFGLFEATFFDYQSAVHFDDTARASVDKYVLNYFTSRLLRNPRLLYYWDPNGGKLSAEYQQETVDYYNAHVLHDGTNPLKDKEKPDAKGPLTD